MKFYVLNEIFKKPGVFEGTLYVAKSYLHTFVSSHVLFISGLYLLAKKGGFFFVSLMTWD